jgi:hypothetical protein
MRSGRYRQELALDLSPSNLNQFAAARLGYSDLDIQNAAKFGDDVAT